MVVVEALLQPRKESPLNSVAMEADFAEDLLARRPWNEGTHMDLVEETMQEALCFRVEEHVEDEEATAIEETPRPPSSLLHLANHAKVHRKF